MKKTLLMLNMSHRFDWDKGIVNRNYHVLQKLIEFEYFDSVVSVDFLPFTLKKKIKVLLKGGLWKKGKNTVYRSLTCRVVKEQDKNLWHVTALNLKKIDKVLQKINISIEEDLTIWSYNPFAANFLNRFPNAKIIFDTVDNWIEHPSYLDYTEKLKECYKIIQKKAGVIFTVSEGLIDFFGKKGNIFFIPNGVSVDHFKDAVCNTQFINKSKTVQEGASSKIIGYHGIIQSRVNISVFEYLAEKHPDYQFVIVGPVWKEVEKDIDKLKEFDNVHLLGAVPYSELPSVIQCFDVAIIPHRVDKFTQSMNPLKIYEYLAAGKPIISTAIAGADQFQDLISLAVSPEDFSKKIQEELQSNTSELEQRRKAMALKYDWTERVKVMISVMEKQLVKKEE